MKSKTVNSVMYYTNGRFSKTQNTHLWMLSFEIQHMYARAGSYENTVPDRKSSAAPGESLRDHGG